MAKLFKIVEGVYAYVGGLPPGCRLCIRGGKVVIFITGLCDEKCFYCPIPLDRMNRDVVFADEEPVRNIDEILDEIDAVGAEGASITGGDPLQVPQRTINIIRMLKEFYGDSFHVHLYTNGLYATREILKELERAGLDEIRFHIVRQDVGLERVRSAVELLKHVDVGVEVPVIPGSVDSLKGLIIKLNNIGVKFINLNELEVSESNIRKLLLRGYKISPRGTVVEGSEETALELVRWASRENLRIMVHYCPASYKDSVQMRARLIRKAVRLAKPYERVRPDGLLEAAIVKGEAAGKLVRKGYGEPRSDGRAAVALEVVRELGVSYEVTGYYPTLRRLRGLPGEVVRVA